jgi:hypothetical protein
MKTKITAYERCRREEAIVAIITVLYCGGTLWAGSVLLRAVVIWG